MIQQTHYKLAIFCAHMVNFCRPGHICTLYLVLYSYTIHFTQACTCATIQINSKQNIAVMKVSEHTHKEGLKRRLGYNFTVRIFSLKQLLLRFANTALNWNIKFVRVATYVCILQLIHVILSIIYSYEQRQQFNFYSIWFLDGKLMSTCFTHIFYMQTNKLIYLKTRHYKRQPYAMYVQVHMQLRMYNDHLQCNDTILNTTKHKNTLKGSYMVRIN